MNITLPESITIHVGRNIGPKAVDLTLIHVDTITRALTRGLRDMVNDAGADPKKGAKGCEDMLAKILAGTIIGGGADPSRGRVTSDPWMKLCKELAHAKGKAKGRTVKEINKVLEKYPTREAVEDQNPDFALEVQAEFDRRQTMVAELDLGDLL